MWEEVMTFTTKLHLYGKVGGVFPEREKEIFLVLSYLIDHKGHQIKKWSTMFDDACNATSLQEKDNREVS